MAVIEFTSGLVYKFLFTILICIVVKWGYNTRCRYREEAAFAKLHGCQPPQSEFKHRWPLALDLVKRHVASVLTDHALLIQVEFTEELGITFATYMFGVIGYFTSDPRNIKAMMETRFQDMGLGLRRHSSFPFFGEGIFTQDGPAWKHSREMLRRQFARVQARDLDTFTEQVETLISTFQDSKGVVDLQPAFFRFTLATTTTLIFGESIETLSQAEQDEFATQFDIATRGTAVRLPMAHLSFLYNPPSYRKACKIVKRYADHFIEKAFQYAQKCGQEAATEKYPFIFDLHREYQDRSLVRDQLVNVLLAGRDTTACTMSWAIFLLVRHPEMLQRLRKEINEVAGSQEMITRSHTKNMPYLNAVLNETLRLYPPVHINSRCAIRTTLLPKGGGPDGESPVLVPKNAGITFSPYQMHRRKELFGEDAHEYKPERWLDGKLANIGCAYIPFLHGFRTCLGKDFALSEASYGLVRLLQEYPNLRIAPGTEVVPTGQEKQMLTLVVSSLEGCKVVLD